MRCGLVCVILLCVTSLSARIPFRLGRVLQDITADARVQQALARLTADAAATTDEQVRITEIPAPPFHEAARGEYLSKLLSAAGLQVHTDEIGNVIGERAGSSNADIVVIAAHLDTVFPANTDVHVKREAGRLHAPGISDNGSGLAALVALARAMRDAKIATRSTILFVADVGEEGEGNLRGMRKLVETYRKQIRYVIALDGSSTDYVTTSALASRRVEITVTGPGGHSWSDFGAPNPIHALARGVTRFVKVPVPDNPRTTFNVGEIEGGTSVNSIPSKASLKIDLRSESEPELAKLETRFREAIQAGIDEEMAAARDRGMSAKPLSVTALVLGIRPGGELANGSPLLAAIQAADEFLGNRSRLERSSTDANIPLSLGIPAISIGAGGRSAGAHSYEEWYDPTGRELGLRRALLALLGVAGVEPIGSAPH
jgi:acetylornithine deacetylase/succinyl-diaminopimelate desuccinylase-like protein